MTTSGTVGATVFRVSDLIDAVARRCGVQPANLTPEGIDVISGAMWRLLAHMSNRGVNLWRIYERPYALQNGKSAYEMQQGDIDVLNMVHRQPTRLSATQVTSSAGGTVSNLSDGDLETFCTQTSSNGNIVWDWGAGSTQQVGWIGVNSAAATLTLVGEISNDGSSWTTVLSPGAASYTALEPWQWYSIDPTGVPSRYFRLRGTGGATLNLAEVVLAQNWTDIEIARWGRDQWAVNPSKRSQGTPRQYYLDRQETPVINVWPVPNAMEILCTLQVFAHRHIEDAGVMANTLNIPERWYQATIDLLSWTVLPELPGADLKRADILKEQALAVTLPDVEKEERDRAPIQLVPGIHAYTR